MSRVRAVKIIEYAAWTIGLIIPIIMNFETDLKHSPGTIPYLVLIDSLYSWPNGILVLGLITIVLISLTFRSPPLTLLLETIINFSESIFSLGGFRMEFARDPLRSPDEVNEQTLRSFIRRSEQVARTARGRPQVLLFVGAMIAFAGLIFFVATLPQEGGLLRSSGSYGKLPLNQDIASLASPELLNKLSPDERNSILGIKTPTERFINDVLPRLLMLVFIQVLAGFFLRQYRAAVEDFRYYEAILRRRETEALAYSLYKAHPNEDPIKDYVKMLLSSQEFGVIKKGDTTMVLEAAKMSENELQTTIENILSKIGISNLLKRP
jgi:hypothetical protein